MAAMIRLRGRMKYVSEISSTPNGVMMKTFKICNGWKKAGETIFNWYKCIGFNDMALRITEEFAQDDYVEVEGWLQIDSYTDKLGENKSVHTVIVQKIEKHAQSNYEEPSAFNERPQSPSIPNLGDIPF